MLNANHSLFALAESCLDWFDDNGYRQWQRAIRQVAGQGFALYEDDTTIDADRIAVCFARQFGPKGQSDA